MHSADAPYNGLGMDAVVSFRTRNTNVIMVWDWMLWCSHALGRQTLLLFGLGFLVIRCTQNTNVSMVWAWMTWLSRALGTRTLLWFGHGCPGYPTHSTLNNMMRGIRSISGPRNTSNVWFVPRRPHPERSAEYAFFAHLRSGGANNNNKRSAWAYFLTQQTAMPKRPTDRPEQAQWKRLARQFAGGCLPTICASAQLGLLFNPTSCRAETPHRPPGTGAVEAFGATVRGGCFIISILALLYGCAHIIRRERHIIYCGRWHWDNFAPASETGNPPVDTVSRAN